ncbi:MAG: histidinol-phosphatase [Promicromonosporaceae bacterium]|nr:histidinol-phosphatase [Promicromonosporaceae bacterium]
MTSPQESGAAVSDAIAGVDDLAFALRLADLADGITMASFQSTTLRVSEKPDHTPVTEADQATERALREALATERPDDAVLGEEYGSRVGRSDRKWVIDPIDGTKNYLRGVPIWATLIALTEGSEVLLGVVSAPALGRRWWAAKGQGVWTGVLPELAGGTTTDGEGTTTAGRVVRRIHTSGISDLGHATFAYTSLSGWDQIGKFDGFLKLADKCWVTRGFGDFYSYMLLAEGAVDLVAEPQLETYDMAALVPIVVEAGGTFTSLDGMPGPWGGNALATNGALQDQAFAYLR